MKRPAKKEETTDKTTDDPSPEEAEEGENGEEPTVLKKPAAQALKVYAYPYKSGVWGVKIVGVGEKIRVSCLQKQYGVNMQLTTHHDCFNKTILWHEMTWPWHI